MRQWLTSLIRPSPWGITLTAPSDQPQTKSTSPYTACQGATCPRTRRTSYLHSPSPSRMLWASRSSRPGSYSLTKAKGRKSPPPRWWLLWPLPTSPSSETLSPSSPAPVGLRKPTPLPGLPSAATVTGLATPPLPARHLIRPALSVPTPIPAALTDARTPLVRRWEMSRASQIAVLPPLYVAPTATALTPPLTRIAHPALPP